MRAKAIIGAIRFLSSASKAELGDYVKSTEEWTALINGRQLTLIVMALAGTIVFAHGRMYNRGDG